MLRAHGRMRRLIQTVPHLSDWLDYVYDSYINPNGPFPCPMFNTYDQNVDYRTNNQTIAEFGSISVEKCCQRDGDTALLTVYWSL